MTSTALMILNPRDIPYCMAALRALRVPKFWARYMPEVQAAAKINEAIEATDYDRYVLISDDCEPTQGALDLVLDLHDQGHPVTTGFSNFDRHLPLINLCTRALSPPPPGAQSYGAFRTKDDPEMAGPDPVLTTFTGLSFTCMSRAMWLRYPLTCTVSGGQMDFQLSWELQEAGIPIVAAPGAFVLHHKDRFGIYPDSSPEKQLLVGVLPPEAAWTDVNLEEAA